MGNVTRSGFGVIKDVKNAVRTLYTIFLGADMDGIEKQFYPFADFCVSLFPVKAVNFRLRREGYPVVLGGISFGALVIFAGFGFKNVVCVTVQTGKPFRFIRVLRNGRLPVGTVLRFAFRTFVGL